MAKFSETPVALYAKKVIGLQNRQAQLFKIILDNAKFRDLVKKLNTEVQLRKQSVDSEGAPLFNRKTNRSVYAPSDPLGRGGKPYQVFRTGDYYDSFEIKIGAGIITIISDPEKDNDNLFEVYTENLEGLTEESLEVLINEAQDQYIKYFKNVLLPQ